MKKITIILIMFALMLTACGALSGKAKGESDTNVTKITPSPDKAAMELEAEPVILFQRSGGFAGKSEQWSIYASGKISQPDGEELSVDPAKVTALLDAIQAAGFFDMKASAGIGGLSNCKDCYTYQLTVNGDEKENTITFQDGSKDIPDALWKVIQQINDLIAKPGTQ